MTSAESLHLQPSSAREKGELFTHSEGAVERAAYERYGAVLLWDTGRIRSCC